MPYRFRSGDGFNSVHFLVKAQHVDNSKYSVVLIANLIGNNIVVSGQMKAQAVAQSVSNYSVIISNTKHTSEERSSSKRLYDVIVHVKKSNYLAELLSPWS